MSPLHITSWTLLAAIVVIIGLIGSIGAGFTKYGELTTRLAEIEGRSSADYSAQIAVLEEKVNALENADTSHTHDVADHTHDTEHSHTTTLVNKKEIELHPCGAEHLKKRKDDNFDIIINPDKGDLEIWRNRVVVADGEVEEPNQEISLTDAQKIEKWLNEGQFWRGTMEPKIKAALYFLKHHGEEVVITSINNIEKALKKEAGLEHDTAIWFVVF